MFCKKTYTPIFSEVDTLRENRGQQETFGTAPKIK